MTLRLAIYSVAIGTKLDATPTRPNVELTGADEPSRYFQKTVAVKLIEEMEWNCDSRTRKVINWLFKFDISRVRSVWPSICPRHRKYSKLSTGGMLLVYTFLFAPIRYWNRTIP